MKPHHSIYGLLSSILVIILIINVNDTSAQVKSYKSLVIDSLRVNILTGKAFDDAVELDSIFNILINRHVILRDSNKLKLLDREVNWYNNTYINRQNPLKSVQFAIDESNQYLFVSDSNKLIRIPIRLEAIRDIRSIQLTPCDAPPKSYKIGTIYLDKLTKRLKYYDGKKWRKL